MTERLEDRLARLERERADADRLYNDALTRLDRPLPATSDFPHPPPRYDSSKLSDVNQSWNILREGAPTIDGSIQGRLRGFIWRIVGPMFETQRQFNAALVDHLNRNVAAHDEAQKAAESVIALLRRQVEDLSHFQSLMIQFLQTVTLYVDTKDRSTGGAIEVLNAGMGAITDTWMKRWESLAAREERFVQRLGAIDDLRVTTTMAQQSALALKREVEKLLDETPRPPADSAAATGRPAPPRPEDLDAVKYVGFEDAFRGSREEIRRRLSAYLPLFEGRSDILDFGCGRGEFLDLLREHGISARGLDLNPAMVEASRARGLDVVAADALTYLTSLPDGSLGGVFAAQVVEHLPPGYLSKVIETAAHKVRTGGLIVLETINPACWLAFFESYIRDLTHVRALHPDTLQYLVRANGFHDVVVDFKSPVGDEQKLTALPQPPPDAPPALVDLVSTFNENVARLNARLFTFQDYAVIGRK